MFGEVLGMMSQELAQLPTDLQDQLISSSAPTHPTGRGAGPC